MSLIRVQYRTMWTAGKSVSVPVQNKYSFFHFPEPVVIRIGGTVYETKPDAVILSAPDEPRNFYFPRDTYFSFFHATVEMGELLEKYGIPTNRILYPENPDFLNKGFQKLRMEYLSQDTGAEELQEIYIQELLIRLSRELHRGKTAGVDSKLKMKLFALRMEILSQPEKKWSVTEMARLVSISASRFHVVYKACFRTTPMSDLISARVDQAKAMLTEERDRPLSVIAEKLGYKNQYDFSRQFTKVTGTTPGNYRKNNR